MKAAQALADVADVDLVLSRGRRAKGDNCEGSLHNCGKAFDIKSIDGVEVGFQEKANPKARELIERVQLSAFSMEHVKENFGPAGLWRFSGRNLFWFSKHARPELWSRHQNHIHIGIR